MSPTPTVFELIHRRMKDRSEPGHRQDPYKLAIVAEDGSMRWVVAAGLMSRLEAHGILPDLIVGTSGGGLAATYYATAETRRGSTSILYLNSKGFNRDGKSRKFINPLRIVQGQPPMDIHGLVHTVFTKRVPLKWDNLARSPIPTYLTAITREGELRLQHLNGATEAAQKEAMANTCRIPFLAHNPRDMAVLWDGGIKASIPIRQALELGATHVLVVRCKGSLETWAELTRPSAIEKYVLHPALRLQSPDLLKVLLQRPHNIAEALDYLQAGQPHIAQLALPKVSLSIVESSEARLFRQLVEAWQYAGQALGLPEQPLPAEWAAEAAIYL